jgi:prevent-host-death family protein
VTKAVTIAEAKDQLSRLVHEVEAGGPVHVTRRGRTVAVLMSVADHVRLTSTGGSFWDDLDGFRAQWGLDEAGIEASDWLPERSRDPGRPVDL